MNEADLMKKITDAQGDAGLYKIALESYIARFPDKSRSDDFKHVIENETQVWEGLREWDRLSGKWSAPRVQDIRRVNATQAAELIAEAKSLVEQYPGFPTAERVQSLLPFLEAIQMLNVNNCISSINLISLYQ